MFLFKRVGQYMRYGTFWTIPIAVWFATLLSAPGNVASSVMMNRVIIAPTDYAKGVPAYAYLFIGVIAQMFFALCYWLIARLRNPSFCQFTKFKRKTHLYALFVSLCIIVAISMLLLPSYKDNGTVATVLLGSVSPLCFAFFIDFVSGSIHMTRRLAPWIVLLVICVIVLAIPVVKEDATSVQRPVVNGIVNVVVAMGFCYGILMAGSKYLSKRGSIQETNENAAEEFALLRTIYTGILGAVFGWVVIAGVFQKPDALSAVLNHALESQTVLFVGILIVVHLFAGLLVNIYEVIALKDHDKSVVELVGMLSLNLGLAFIIILVINDKAPGLLGEVDTSPGQFLLKIAAAVTLVISIRAIGLANKKLLRS